MDDLELVKRVKLETRSNLVLTLCDRFEALLMTEVKRKTRVGSNKERNAYMREYMRGWRKGITRRPKKATNPFEGE